MRPRRLTAFDYRGCHRYFVTACTWQRELLFDDVSIPVVAAIVDATIHSRGFAMLGWVYMRDHAHWLLEGITRDADFRATMTLSRQRSAVAYRRIGRGQLWQDGYHERVLRPGEGVESVLDYILENPVKAGIAKRVHDYPHCWIADRWR